MRSHARAIACRTQNLALAAAERTLPLRARQCPCCGWTGLQFRSFAVVEYLRRDVICPGCGSFERHRALASFYPALFGKPGCRPSRLIHFAPEPCLTPTLAALCDRYETSARDSAASDLRLDLTSLTLPDHSCDALVMNHVLDCMPDDRPAVTEMFRVLRPGGRVLAVVTFEAGGVTRELPVASNSRYRVYGSTDIGQRFAPFELTVANAAEGLASGTRRSAGIPAMVPVLVLRKP
jgi:SAM-dependent methyltransferase